MESGVGGGRPVFSLVLVGGFTKAWTFIKMFMENMYVYMCMCERKHMHTHTPLKFWALFYQVVMCGDERFE